MNSFTLENSFYGYDYGPETRVYTQKNYREIGASLYWTFNDYRQCIAQIQTEMVQSKGWLKPMTLKQLTGTPAAELIAKEMKEKKMLKRKADYIKKYTVKMAQREAQKGVSIAPLPSNETGQKSLRRQTTLNLGGKDVQSPQPLTKNGNNSKLQSASLQKKTSNMNLTKKVPLANHKSRSNSMTAKSDQGRKTKLKRNKEDSQDQESADEVADIVTGTREISPVKKGLPQENQEATDTRLQAQNDSQLKDSHGVPVGRESALTLLAESVAEKQRISHFRGQVAANPEALMRGKFGKPLNKLSDRDASALMMYNFENERAQMSGLNSLRNDAELNSDENGEFCDRIDDWVPTDNDLNQPLKVEDWRQLFDQDELERAYHQSMIGFGITQVPQTAESKRVVAVGADLSYEQISEEGEHEGSSPVHNQEKNLTNGQNTNSTTTPTQKDNKLLVNGLKLETTASDSQKQLPEDNKDQNFSENGDSDSDASDDNLGEKDLYKQVYLHQDNAIEQAMRQTSYAQNNFIQEVKIMIKKRQPTLKKGSTKNARPGRESTNNPNFAHNGKPYSSVQNENGQIYNSLPGVVPDNGYIGTQTSSFNDQRYYEQLRNAVKGQALETFGQINFGQTLQGPMQSLLLKGTQIENPNREKQAAIARATNRALAQKALVNPNLMRVVSESVPGQPQPQGLPNPPNRRQTSQTVSHDLAENSFVATKIDLLEDQSNSIKIAAAQQASIKKQSLQLQIEGAIKPSGFIKSQNERRQLIKSLNAEKIQVTGGGADLGGILQSNRLKTKRDESSKDQNPFVNIQPSESQLKQNYNNDSNKDLIQTLSSEQFRVSSPKIGTDRSHRYTKGIPVPMINMGKILVKEPQKNILLGQSVNSKAENVYQSGFISSSQEQPALNPQSVIKSPNIPQGTKQSYVLQVNTKTPHNNIGIKIEHIQVNSQSEQKPMQAAGRSNTSASQPARGFHEYVLQTPGKDDITGIQGTVITGTNQVRNNTSTKKEWDTGKIIKGNRLTGAVAQRMKLNPIIEYASEEKAAHAIAVGASKGINVIAKRQQLEALDVKKVKTEQYGSAQTNQARGEVIEKRKVKKGAVNPPVKLQPQDITMNSPIVSKADLKQSEKTNKEHLKDPRERNSRKFKSFDKSSTKTKEPPSSQQTKFRQESSGNEIQVSIRTSQKKDRFKQKDASKNTEKQRNLQSYKKQKQEKIQQKVQIADDQSKFVTSEEALSPLPVKKGYKIQNQTEEKKYEELPNRHEISRRSKSTLKAQIQKAKSNVNNTNNVSKITESQLESDENFLQSQEHVMKSVLDKASYLQKDTSPDKTVKSKAKTNKKSHFNRNSRVETQIQNRRSTQGTPISEKRFDLFEKDSSVLKTSQQRTNSRMSSQKSEKILGQITVTAKGKTRVYNQELKKTNSRDYGEGEVVYTEKFTTLTSEVDPETNVTKTLPQSKQKASHPVGQLVMHTRSNGANRRQKKSLLFFQAPTDECIEANDDKSASVMNSSSLQAYLPKPTTASDQNPNSASGNNKMQQSIRSKTINNSGSKVSLSNANVNSANISRQNVPIDLNLPGSSTSNITGQASSTFQNREDTFQLYLAMNMNQVQNPSLKIQYAQQMQMQNQKKLRNSNALDTNVGVSTSIAPPMLQHSSSCSPSHQRERSVSLGRASFHLENSRGDEGSSERAVGPADENHRADRFSLQLISSSKQESGMHELKQKVGQSRTHARSNNVSMTGGPSGSKKISFVNSLNHSINQRLQSEKSSNSNHVSFDKGYASVYRQAVAALQDQTKDVGIVRVPSLNQINDMNGIMTVQRNNSNAPVSKNSKARYSQYGLDIKSSDQDQWSNVRPSVFNFGSGSTESVPKTIKKDDSSPRSLPKINRAQLENRTAHPDQSLSFRQLDMSNGAGTRQMLTLDDRDDEICGWQDDQMTLANINIIKVANSGLSPTTAKLKNQKSKFVKEQSGVARVKQDREENNNSRLNNRLRLKSLLNEAPNGSQAISGGSSQKQNHAGSTQALETLVKKQAQQKPNNGRLPMLPIAVDRSYAHHASEELPNSMTQKKVKSISKESDQRHGRLSQVPSQNLLMIDSHRLSQRASPQLGIAGYNLRKSTNHR